MKRIGKLGWIAMVGLVLAGAAWAGEGPPENDMGVREYDELVLTANPKVTHQGFFRREPNGNLSRNAKNMLIFRIEVGSSKGITTFHTDEEIYAMHFVQTEEEVFRKRIKKELRPSRIQIPAYERKAEEALGKGFDEIAEELYRSIVKLDPTYLKGYTLLGRHLRRLFKFNDELRLYESGLTAGVVKKEILHTSRGTLLFKLGLPETAEQAYLMALDENPKHGEALLEYGRLLAARRSYRRAEEMLRSALTAAYSTPEKGRCQHALGNVLLKLSDLEGAKKQFEDAAFNLPEDPAVKVALGSIHYLLGDTARAKEVFMEVLGIESIGTAEPGAEEGSKEGEGTEGEDPGEGEGETEGNTEEEGGEEESSEEGEEEEDGEQVFTEFSPFKSNVYVNLALCLVRESDYANALAYLDKAAGIDPTSARPHTLRGYISEKQGDFDGALDAYRKGIEIDPTCAYAHYATGQIHLGRSELPQAVEAYQLAIKCNHVFSDAFYKLGIIAINEERPADAVRFIGHAISLAPTRVDRKVAMGVALIMEKKYREAEVVFKEALSLDAANLLAKVGEIYLLYYKPKWEAAAKERLQMLKEDTEDVPEVIADYITQIVMLIDENMGKAQWIDTFDRPDAFTVGRKWEEKERFGILVKLKENAVSFEGGQKKPGETVLETPRPAPDLVRFEIDLRISSYETFRAGIRLVYRMAGRKKREDIRAGVFFGRDEKNRLVYGTWDPSFKRWKTIKELGEWPVNESGSTKTNRLGVELVRSMEGKNERYLLRFLLDGKPVDEGFEHDRFKRKVSSGDYWVGVYAEGNLEQKVSFTAENANIIIWKRE